VGFAEMVDFDRRQGRVVIEKGRYKAYHMPIFYYVADVIEWYCVGDGAEIERLLSTCAYIGKKSAQGWGRVIEWRVEAWPEDWSERREGSLTRGLPAGTMPAMDMGAVVYGIRPPYYLKENQTMVMFPDG
jgi:CRISPR type IV-associated protein Csf3